MKWWLWIYVLCAMGSLLAAPEPKIICQQKWKELEFEGMKIRLYRLRAESFPSGQNYKLFIRTVDGATTETFHYVSNAKGHLIINEPEDVLRAAPYIVTPLRKGEMVGYGMLSSQGAQEYYTAMVPFPNEATKGKLKIAVDLSDINGRSFVCRGSGFGAKEALTLLIEYGDQFVSYPVIAHEEGSFAFPFVTQAEGTGDALLKVERSRESLSVTFPWGQRAGEFVGASCLEIK